MPARRARDETQATWVLFGSLSPSECRAVLRCDGVCAKHVSTMRTVQTVRNISLLETPRLTV